MFCTMMSNKKFCNGLLTLEQVTRDWEISLDKVLIENHFARLCSFTLFGSKWHRNARKYSAFVRFGVPLTNAHIVCSPLWNSDRALFNSILYRLVFIGKTQTKKRASSQHEYNKRRHQQLSVMMSSVNSSEQESSESDHIDSLNKVFRFKFSYGSVPFAFIYSAKACRI